MVSVTQVLDSTCVIAVLEAYLGVPQYEERESLSLELESTSHVLSFPSLVAQRYDAWFIISSGYTWL